MTTPTAYRINCKVRVIGIEGGQTAWTDYENLDQAWAAYDRLASKSKQLIDLVSGNVLREVAP